MSLISQFLLEEKNIKYFLKYLEYVSFQVRIQYKYIINITISLEKEKGINSFIRMVTFYKKKCIIIII